VEICFKTLPVPGNGTDVSLGSCFPPGSGGYEAYNAYAQNVWNSNLFVNGRIEVVGNSAVKSLNKTPASILLHPNPTNSSSTLYLETPYSGAGQIQVDNLAGQLTWKQAISLQAGKNIFHIPAEAFPEGGIYLVSVLSAQGRLQRKVIVY
ncbi:MAG: T9SS type A sorting domain-containing protein, partial [Saprospiraceae bacterium]|nr:T9SS type A sorting domain-containing protein [Saprospiraceae bacterium]